jgi:hypothetical protein
MSAASGALAQAQPPETPTTRVLAIGKFAPGTDMQLVQRTLPAEVRATAELYLQGKIDQWYSLENRPGECSSCISPTSVWHEPCCKRYPWEPHT